MIWYAARRLLGLLVTVVAAAVLVFVLFDLLAGDQARFILGIGATDQSVAALRGELGLDQAPWLRVLSGIANMLRGDFGLSYAQGTGAGGLIADRLAVTIPLFVIALLGALAIGAAAIPASLRPGSVGERILETVAGFVAAIPAFWLGMVMVVLFSVVLHLLPPGGFVPWTVNPLAALGSLVVPALAIALPAGALLAQEFHGQLVVVRRSPYIRALRARGMTAKEAMWRHGLRNALQLSLGAAGPVLAYILTGAVIVENVFYLPGLGRLILDAITAHDLILVRSSVVVLIALVAILLFLVEIGRGWLDPRRRGGSG